MAPEEVSKKAISFSKHLKSENNEVVFQVSFYVVIATEKNQKQ